MGTGSAPRAGVGGHDGGRAVSALGLVGIPPLFLAIASLDFWLYAKVGLAARDAAAGGDAGGKTVALAVSADGRHLALVGLSAAADGLVVTVFPGVNLRFPYASLIVPPASDGTVLAVGTFAVRAVKVAGAAPWILYARAPHVEALAARLRPSPKADLC